MITRHGAAVAELRPLPADAFTAVAELKRAFAGIQAGDHAAMRAQADVVFGEDRVGG